MTETVWLEPEKLSPMLATSTVSVARSTARFTGPPGSVMLAGGWPQPERVVALQVRVLITDTVLAPMFATYAVPVAGSSAIPCGLEPVGSAMAPVFCSQPRV